MKSFFTLGALAGAVLLSTSSFAAPGDIVMRVRAVNIATHNSSSPVAGVEVSKKTIPEIDFSYYFSDVFSAELILTYPQKHDVSLSGTKLGTLKQLPPTLLAQYHFMPGSSYSPYVGAGLNYTLFSGVDIPGLDVKRSSIGGALQVGIDFPIDKNMSFNIDLKKIYMKTDVKTTAGAYVTTLKVDPVLFGIGLGWKL
ncbi:MAG: outer membrane beta-barrel protein [Gallionella sp.]|nr:outer membrane beta-barrel protein [Gallionella sp.]